MDLAYPQIAPNTTTTSTTTTSIAIAYRAYTRRDSRRESKKGALPTPLRGLPKQKAAFAKLNKFQNKLG